MGHQLCQRGLEDLFVGSGLTSTQWSALVAIDSGRGNTCATLARDLAHDTGATTRIIDALQAAGWVTRERAAEDRRVVRLALTEAGRGLAMQVLDGVLSRWNGWLEEWPTDDVRTLITLLQRLHGTLDANVRSRSASLSTLGLRWSSSRSKWV
ncbi:MAG: MarR family winged helix-turn-helix transcriptional regulator [Janthinobacterium lividum]